mgnify:CR=1 FL=1
MASIKKKSSGGGGGANWMDTYGDMVTLLLCFFVLLYSISTIDVSKWMLVVQSFNRDAMVNPKDDPPGPTDSSENQTGGAGLPATTDMEQALEDLEEYLQLTVASDDISVSKGDGFVFISFAESVFFTPDSSVLRKEGKEVLDQLIPALRQCAPFIDELQVMGHTAQARDVPNRTVFDRQLASMRATEVVIFLQDSISYELLNPGRLVPIGFGQWRNVAPNDTPEGKSRNRRVEMMITGRELDDTLSGNYAEYSTMLKSTGSIEVPD